MKTIKYLLFSFAVISGLFGTAYAADLSLPAVTLTTNESGEQQGIVEYPVDEINGDVVAQDNLLGKAVQNPEDRDPELPAAQRKVLV